MPKPRSKAAVRSSPIVTFPIHITRDVWDRFKKALAKGQSAHGVLLKYIEQFPKQKRKTRRTR